MQRSGAAESLATFELRGSKMAGKLGAAIYRSREWQALRAACKAAARGLCEDCHGAGFECHHRIPLYLGGPLLPDLSGVVWLCRRCHLKNHKPAARRAWDRLLARLRGA